jgi:uncharacterized protein
VGARSDSPVTLTSASDYDIVFGAPGSDPVGLAVHDFFRQGGTVAVAVPAPAALDALGLFNLLVVPGEQAAEVVAAAVAAAEARGALCILDPPAAWSTVDLAAAGVGDPEFRRSPNAAVYFPRIAGPGPVRGPAGAVAGVIARFDVLRGVWTSPAGVEADLRGVDALDVAVRDVDQDVLNPLGVNCLRTFAGAGPVVWGARTTAGEQSEWKYIPVRRMSLFIKHSIERSTQWVTFEPNDERLCARLRAEVGAFLDALYRDGAFKGSTPRDAYFVRCDGDTSSPAVNVVAGFAPLRAAEFVTVDVRLTTAGPDA